LAAPTARKNPLSKDYEQSPEAVRQWLDEQYPAIAEHAKAEGGEIHWGDETALVNPGVLVYPGGPGAAG
jgi:hypothetical protein